MILMLPYVVMGQLSRGDSLLLNERTMDRPLVTHQGQLRFSTGYNYSIFNAVFDADGEKTQLSETGEASVLHNVYFGLEFGVLEFFQLSARLSHNTQSFRSLPLAIAGGPTFYQIFTVDERKGLEDLELGADLRIPFLPREIDVILYGGMTMPTAPHEPDQPEHTIGGNTTVNLNYRSKWGRGVSTSTLGGILKYRLTDLAFTVQFDVNFPMEEGENIDWLFREVNGGFEYEQRSYAYDLPERYMFTGQIEYQLYPWLNIFGEGSYASSLGGWTEITGKRVANPEEIYIRFSPGAEILATGRFWLRQQLDFPISGQSVFSTFRIQTRLSYNLFAF